MTWQGITIACVPRLTWRDFSLQRGLRTKQEQALGIEISHWQNLCALLLEERIELFVANADMLANDPRFLITPLPSEPSAIFCDSAHPLAQQVSPVRLEQLLDYPWAAMRFTTDALQRIRKTLQLGADTALPPTIDCNDPNLMKQLLLGSDTLLFTWRSWLQQELAQGRLIDLNARLRPSPAPDEFMLDCAIVQLAGRTLSPVARRTVELLLQHAWQAGQ